MNSTDLYVAKKILGFSSSLHLPHSWALYVSQFQLDRYGTPGRSKGERSSLKSFPNELSFLLTDRAHEKPGSSKGKKLFEDCFLMPVLEGTGRRIFREYSLKTGTDV